MSVPVKVHASRPVAPAVTQVPDTRSTSAVPNAADVVRARTLVGGTAVTAAVGGLPRCGPEPSGCAGQSLLAGQNLIGNQAVVRQAVAVPATPVVAPVTTRKTLPPKATAPAAATPGVEEPASTKRPEKGAAEAR